MKTYKDVYQFPLKTMGKYDKCRIYDSLNNFVFQFELGNAVETHGLYDRIVRKLNGEDVPRRSNMDVKHENGYIFIGPTHVITIRGWGGLTGIGGHNLPADVAENIQNTFAEFIVETLSNKE